MAGLELSCQSNDQSIKVLNLNTTKSTQIKQSYNFLSRVPVLAPKANYFAI